MYDENPDDSFLLLLPSLSLRQRQCFKYAIIRNYGEALNDKEITYIGEYLFEDSDKT